MDRDQAVIKSAELVAWVSIICVAPEKLSITNRYRRYNKSG